MGEWTNGVHSSVKENRKLAQSCCKTQRVYDLFVNYWMTPMSTILDPTDERNPVVRSPSHREKNLQKRVAMLDIAKPRGNVLLDRLEEILKERYPEVEVSRYSKPTFTKPAPLSLRQEIQANNDVVLEALAD